MNDDINKALCEIFSALKELRDICSESVDSKDARLVYASESIENLRVLLFRDQE